jgi:hypothetical protein
MGIPPTCPNSELKFWNHAAQRIALAVRQALRVWPPNSHQYHVTLRKIQARSNLPMVQNRNATDPDGLVLVFGFWNSVSLALRSVPVFQSGTGQGVFRGGLQCVDGTQLLEQ